MAQFRQDPISGQWVSIASQRAQRPIDFEDNADGAPDDACPFCEGKEADTPHEVLALRNKGTPADGPGWNVRVVTNKYPFVAAANSAEEDAVSAAFFHAAPGQGIHEVIIESPRHISQVTDLSDAELAGVLSVYRDRLRQLRDEQRWPYALIFKNSGGAAGASLAHIHSQLVALPMTPAAVEASIERAKQFQQITGRMIWEEMIRRECEVGERLVALTDRFVAFCPFASRQPFEMRVFPKQQAAHFSETADDALSELAALLRMLIARLEGLLKPLAFNWMFNTCPFDTLQQEHYHWHVEIVPRVTKTAGYEWVTGHAVNTLSPEAAADLLRK